MNESDRRTIVKTVAAATALTAASAFRPAGATPAPRIRFGVVGISHPHIYLMCDAVIRGGGELTMFHTTEENLVAEFQRRYPNARRVADERRIIEDRHIKLVASSIIPVQRAPLGIRVMQAGKDFMADKPGIISLDQLAEVKRTAAETRRIYSIAYSERFDTRASVRAGQLIQAGAIGDVVQTMGTGPHRINPSSRPAWFWDPTQYGGIICDIGSHQMDQFLFYTGSTEADVVASQVGNFHNQDHAEFQDFGDAMLRGNKGVGYVQLNWFTPQGLPVWGDGRNTIVGSAGYIELRKYIDIAGRPGANHLFLVDNSGVQYIDCSDTVLPYGPQLVDDVLNRTETAMTQAHCFLATELALKAQANARRIETQT
ncbi:MAG TPA: Gfo/Idh/MocA family oxidoreductase [Caulobacterales bacterium]|nr:Gfo/Idh/MocA family oxidoreductase [Caulobacterales bacterium]